MYQKKIVGRCIGNLSNQIRRRLDACSARRGISGSQGRVIHFVMEQSEEVFQRDLEQEFYLRAPSATQLLNLMEKNGLIRRASTAQDARLKRIVVTDKAIALIGTVIPDLDEMERDLTRGISPERLEVFFSVVEQMSDNLKNG